VVVKEPPWEKPHQYRACPAPPIDVPRIARLSLLLVDGRNGERRLAGSVKEFLGRGHGGEVLSRRQQVGDVTPLGIKHAFTSQSMIISISCMFIIIWQYKLELIKL
jgi:hypothetical protein